MKGPDKEVELQPGLSQPGGEARPTASAITRETDEVECLGQRADRIAALKDGLVGPSTL
jgi:hypothetical protein